MVPDARHIACRTLSAVCRSAAAGLVPTTLRVTSQHASDLAATEYPPPHMLQLAFAEQPIPVYHGDVEIILRFGSTIAPAPGLELSLTYQACDDRACLPPVTMKLAV